MRWIERLAELTGWDEPAWDCEWGVTESELGTSLPADYKEFCSRFGPGIFVDDYFRPLVDERGGTYSLLNDWREMVDLADRFGTDDMIGPYEVYGTSGTRGVIPWGYVAPNGSVYWLADEAVDPGAWPIVGKLDLTPDEQWHRFDMTVPEFVYRALADPDFQPFNVERWLEGEDVPRTFRRSILKGGGRRGIRWEG